MPVDPTITAALRAAAFAACGCGGMCFKTDGAMFCEAREDQAAAAIAAFLRALPDMRLHLSAAHVTFWNRRASLVMAAAVEAAAHE